MLHGLVQEVSIIDIEPGFKNMGIMGKSVAHFTPKSLALFIRCRCLEQKSAWTAKKSSIQGIDGKKFQAN